MFKSFSSETADELWNDLASEFATGEASLEQASRVGQTRELLHVALSLSNPRQRWVVSRVPALNPAFALAEIVWILAGRNDSSFLNYFNSKLPQFSGTDKSYHGAYGHRL